MKTELSEKLKFTVQLKVAVEKSAVTAMVCLDSCLILTDHHKMKDNYLQPSTLLRNTRMVTVPG